MKQLKQNFFGRKESNFKTYEHQIWQSGTSTGNKTNQAGAGDDITSRSRDKLKYISTTTVPMTTKLDRMVAYLDGLLPIKSHDPLLAWSCEIT